MSGWIRPSSLFVLLVFGLAPLTGCAEVLESPGSNDAADEAAPSVEAKTASEGGWIELTLEDGPDASYAREAIHVAVTDPDGRTLHKLCSSPELGDDGCASDFDDEWVKNTSVWAPCLGEGLHHVEIHVLGEQALSEGLTCEGPATQDGDNGQETKGGDGHDAGDGSEQASATANGVDLDDDGDVEWVKVTLTSGENAPYPAEEVTEQVRNADGDDRSFFCDTASDPDCEETDDQFRAADGDEWNLGENLWVPCHENGTLQLSVEVHGSTIVDATVRCDEAA